MALPALPSLGDIVGSVGNATNALDPKNLINPKTDHITTVRDLVDWAGWNGADVDTMTAIALAEGGGLLDQDGNVKCEANFAGCCWGLFQINLGAWKVDKELACDNAKAAKFAHDTIFKAQGFKAWEAYTNGSYQKFKGQNKKVNVEKGIFGGGTTQEGPGGVNLPDLSPGAAIKGLVEIVALLSIVLKPLLGVAAKNSPGGKAFLFQRTKVSTQ
jgi:hypothetical protein